jgi:hypothetical protein
MISPAAIPESNWQMSRVNMGYLERIPASLAGFASNRSTSCPDNKQAFQTDGEEMQGQRLASPAV